MASLFPVAAISAGFLLLCVILASRYKKKQGGARQVLSIMFGLFAIYCAAGWASVAQHDYKIDIQPNVILALPAVAEAIVMLCMIVKMHRVKKARKANETPEIAAECAKREKRERKMTLIAIFAALGVFISIFQCNDFSSGNNYFNGTKVVPAAVYFPWVCMGIGFALVAVLAVAVYALKRSKKILPRCVLIAVSLLLLLYSGFDFANRAISAGSQFSEAMNTSVMVSSVSVLVIAVLNFLFLIGELKALKADMKEPEMAYTGSENTAPIAIIAVLGAVVSIVRCILYATRRIPISIRYGQARSYSSALATAMLPWILLAIGFALIAVLTLKRVKKIPPRCVRIVVSLLLLLKTGYDFARLAISAGSHFAQAMGSKDMVSYMSVLIAAVLVFVLLLGDLKALIADIRAAAQASRERKAKEAQERAAALAERAAQSGDAGVAAGGKSKVAAALLAWFLGWVGAHRYYLGYKKQGIIQSCGGGALVLGSVLAGTYVNAPSPALAVFALLFSLFAAVTTIWAFVDFIRILLDKLLPSDGTPYAKATGGKSKVTAALLAFFLGSTGAHRYYLGYKKEGIIQSCGCVSLVLGSVLTSTYNTLNTGANVSAILSRSSRVNAPSPALAVFALIFSLFGGATCIWAFVDFIRILLDKLLPSDGTPYAQTGGAAPQPAVSNVETLEKLAKLHEQGILTDEEFQQKKEELLAKI